MEGNYETIEEIFNAVYDCSLDLRHVCHFGVSGNSGCFH